MTSRATIVPPTASSPGLKKKISVLSNRPDFLGWNVNCDNLYPEIDSI